MVEPARVYRPLFHGGAQGAARFAVVATVAEAAPPQVGPKLREGVLQGGDVKVSQAEHL
jgi:hypothetical protein